jgi:hypothetical protein
MTPTPDPTGPLATDLPPQYGTNMVDKPTPPQGTLNNDAANTGGGTVSLVDQGTGTPGASTTSNRGPGRSRVPFLIIGTIVLALIGGGLIAWSQLSGSPDPKPTPPPATTPSANTSQNTPSPTPTITAEQVAVQGATAGYVHYREVVNAMYASGGKVTSGLAAVATGTAIKIDQSGAKTYRNRALRQIGASTLVWTKATSIGSPNATGAITQITLSSCIDSAKSNTVDSSGKALPKQGGATARLTEQTDMVLVSGVWKATERFNQLVKTC